MSAGRPREAVGAVARRTTHRVRRSAADRRTNRQWDSNPGSNRSKQRQTCGTGPARHPRRDALCSLSVRPPCFVVLRISQSPRYSLSGKESGRSSDGPGQESPRNSVDVRASWPHPAERACDRPAPKWSRFRWNAERASRCGARCAASRCPSSGGPAAPPRTPIRATRPRRHPRKRRQPSRSLRGAASQRRLFPFVRTCFRPAPGAQLPMRSPTEATIRRQHSVLLPLVWRALESGRGSVDSLKPNGACPVYAFPGIDRQHTPRGRPS
jgi:hypothetical protein